MRSRCACSGIINTSIVKVPGVTTPGISDAQIDRSQRYYAEHGYLPNVVADRIVRSVCDDDAYLFVGPMAKPASVLARVSRRLTGRATIADSRKSGYLV